MFTTDYADPFLFTNIFTMPKNNKFDDCKLKIKSWLQKHKFEVQEVDEISSAWLMVAQSQAGVLAVSIRLDEPENVALAMNSPLARYQNLANSLPSAERKELLLDLKIHLIPLNVSFIFEEEGFSNVLIFRDIYIEELSRSLFWQTVENMSKAHALIRYLLDKKFLNEIKQPFTPPATNVNQ